MFWIQTTLTCAVCLCVSERGPCASHNGWRPLCLWVSERGPCVSHNGWRPLCGVSVCVLVICELNIIQMVFEKNKRLCLKRTYYYHYYYSSCAEKSLGVCDFLMRVCASAEAATCRVFNMSAWKHCVIVLLGQVNNPKVSRNRGTPSVSVGLRVPHNTDRLLVLHLRLVLVVLGTVSK